MKKLALVLLLLLFVRPAFGQPHHEVVDRIQQALALLQEEPGGYDTLFAPIFLSQVTPHDLTSIFTNYSKEVGAITRWNYIDSLRPWGAKIDIWTAKNLHFAMSIAVEDSGAHRITGLLMGLARPPFKTLAEVRDKFAKMRGATSMMVARLNDGAIEPIETYNADSALAIGSAFKLYVLATLLKDINQGARHWDDVINLDSASRAFPSGQMHTWPVGTPITLATAAAMMISISDNTAADLLIHTLRREHVESMVKEAGSTHASMNVPFLTTLEMMKLKEVKHDLGKRYASMAPDKRRAFLDHDVAAFPRDSIGYSQGMIDKIEWFASPRDIVNVLDYILEHSKTSEGSHVRDVLAINPGLPISTNRWDYIGFKGGSEPGVLNMSYLLHSKLDGKWYAITASWNDAGSTLQEDQFAMLVQTMTELVP